MKTSALLEIVHCILLVFPLLKTHHVGPQTLTADSCSNSTTFLNIHGTFQTYSLYLDVDPGMDEFKPLVATCGLNSSVPEECKEFVEGTLQNISIAVNGTVQDHRFSEYYRPNLKQFGTALHVEEHEKAEINCILALADGTLISNTKTVGEIDELHPYKIVPASVDVTVGKSYTLTCVTDTVRGLEEMSWTQWSDSEGFETPVKCNDAGEHFASPFCTIENTESHDPPYSVLTVSTKHIKHANETVEYTYRCNAAVDHTHQHKMLGEARVTVRPRKDRGFGMGLGIAAAIVVLAVLILSAVILFRRSKLTTVMTYGKLEEEA